MEKGTDPIRGMVSDGGDIPYHAQGSLPGLELDSKADQPGDPPGAQGFFYGQAAHHPAWFIEDPPSERHPASQAFVDRVTGWMELHDQKQLDYGKGDDPFANIRRVERMQIPAWVGCVIRMADKMARLEVAVEQFLTTGEVKLANEGVLDSFDDMGVYSGIGAVLFEEWSA